MEVSYLPFLFHRLESLSCISLRRFTTLLLLPFVPSYDHSIGTQLHSPQLISAQRRELNPILFGTLHITYVIIVQILTHSKMPLRTQWLIAFNSTIWRRRSNHATKHLFNKYRTSYLCMRCHQLTILHHLSPLY